MDKFIKVKHPTVHNVDLSTGELTECYITKKVSPEMFITLYFRSERIFMSLTGNQIKLLYQCWKLCSLPMDSGTEGNVVYNTPFFKDAVRQAGLKLSDNSINTEMSRLAKVGLLRKIGKGVYVMNPLYFFKGRVTDRTKLLMQLYTHDLEEGIVSDVFD